MGEVISVSTHKGGVGKTTTVRNLADFFSREKNLKTLIIDADHQRSCTKSFGVDTKNLGVPTLDIYLLSKEPVEVHPLKITENLHLIPARPQMSELELELDRAMTREFVMTKRVIQHIKNSYDIILIDNAPSLNTVCMNSITASDWVLIPLEPAALSLDALPAMQSFITLIKNELNPKVSLLGIFLTKYKEGRVVSKSTHNQLSNGYFAPAFMKTSVRLSEAIVRAEYERKSIFEYDRNCGVANDYYQLGMEICEKLKI